MVLAQFRAIEIDRGEGVETLEHQLLPLVWRERFGRYLEVNAVPPLAVLHPGARRLVAVVERVGDTARGNQRAVDVAGHGDVEPGVVGGFGQVRRGPHTVARREVVEFPRARRATNRGRMVRHAIQ